MFFKTPPPPNGYGGGAKVTLKNIQYFQWLNFVEKHTIFLELKSNVFQKSSASKMDMGGGGGKSHIQKHTIFSVVKFC